MKTEDICLNPYKSIEERVEAIYETFNSEILKYLIFKQDNYQLRYHSVKRACELSIHSLIDSDELLLKIINSSLSDFYKHYAVQYVLDIKKLYIIESKTKDNILKKLAGLRIKDIYILDDVYFTQAYSVREKMEYLSKINLQSTLELIAFLNEDVIELVDKVVLKIRNLDFQKLFAVDFNNTMANDISEHFISWRVQVRAIIFRRLYEKNYIYENISNIKCSFIRKYLIEYIRDSEKVLVYIAQKDIEPSVRRKALKYIRDKKILKCILKEEKSKINKLYIILLLIFS